MYCIKCGVELAEHEKKCPLCGTEIIYPEFIKNAPAPFPENKTVYRELNRNGFLSILSFLIFTAAALTLICDLSRSGTVVWSGYAAGGIALGYIIIILPMWFKKREPVLFLAVDFASVLLYLYYINQSIQAKWFTPFALPVVVSLAALICLSVFLCRYFRQKILYILGGAFIMFGGFIVFTEFLLIHTFGLAQRLVWSVYPLTVFALIGAALLTVAACPKLRNYLERKLLM